jgi:Right handed beta helix region
MKQLFLCIILSALPLRAQTVTIVAHVGGEMGQKITNAANSVICLNGCTINVPPGVYALTTTAKLPNGRKNIKLIGTGAVLTGNVSLNTMISVQGDNGEVRGFTFHTNGSNYGIVASDGYGQIIAANHFSGPAGVYIAVSGSPGGLRATDNDFNGVTGCASQGDITVFLSAHFAVTNNTAQNTCGFAIQTTASQHGIISHNTIQQTTFRSSLTANGSQRSFVFNWAPSPRIQRVWVQKDDIADNAPVVTYTDAPHTTVTYSKAPQRGSVITALGWTALENIQVNSQSWDITVSNNVINGSGDSGIDIVSDFHGTVIGSAQTTTASSVTYTFPAGHPVATTPVAVLNGRILTAGEAMITKSGSNFVVTLAFQARLGDSLAVWDFVLNFPASIATDHPGTVTVNGNTVNSVAAACIAAEIATSDVVIEGNVVEDCGIGVSTPAYSSGIFTGGASPLVIRDNVIRNTHPIARAGISVQNIADDTGSVEKLVKIRGNSCVGSFSSGCIFIPTLLGYRQQSIDIQDGQDVPYPQQPDFDSMFTNTPANTDQIQYAQTGGGAQYDTATKMSGTASAKIPAGTSLQIFVRDMAFFNQSIAKVKFWAKRTGTKGSPRVMLVTNLASRTYFQIVPITNTDWREFSFYTSFAGLDTNLLRLDCEARDGQLNIQNVRFSKRAIPR